MVLRSPPIPGTAACNIGDMLDRLDGGRLSLDAASRAERERAGRRSSFPFFDPGFDARIVPLPGFVASDEQRPAAGASPTCMRSAGRMATISSARVSKAFPESAARKVGAGGVYGRRVIRPLRGQPFRRLRRHLPHLRVGQDFLLNARRFGVSWSFPVKDWEGVRREATDGRGWSRSDRRGLTSRPAPVMGRASSQR